MKLKKRTIIVSILFVIACLAMVSIFGPNLINSGVQAWPKDVVPFH